MEYDALHLFHNFSGSSDLNSSCKKARRAAADPISIKSVNSLDIVGPLSCFPRSGSSFKAFLLAFRLVHTANSWAQLQYIPCVPKSRTNRSRCSGKTFHEFTIILFWKSLRPYLLTMSRWVELAYAKSGRGKEADFFRPDKLLPAMCVNQRAAVIVVESGR